MCMQTCRTCGVVKQLNEFPHQMNRNNFRGSGESTYRKHCKACVATAAKQRRAAGYTPSGKVTAYPIAERLTVSACRRRAQDAKQRATKSGIRYEVDGDYLYTVYKQQQGLCAISKLPLSIIKGEHHVLSLDQIDAGAGYVRGNVQWLSWAVNRAKGDLGTSEFIELCRIIGRCNDYPEMEYSQVAGSAQHSEE